jgi:hypothetical protein
MISRRTTGSCRDGAVRDANAQANRGAYRKYPDTKEPLRAENPNGNAQGSKQVGEGVSISIYSFIRHR